MTSSVKFFMPKALSSSQISVPSLRVTLPHVAPLPYVPSAAIPNALAISPLPQLASNRAAFCSSVSSGVGSGSGSGSCAVEAVHCCASANSKSRSRAAARIFAPN